uniref:Uncharacterized protein n=1 Tax=Rousettus aegyptiacus TaxID=9407 RepID=A0A7J8GAL7_ROUAE|nr:hypothetical protein HJG63_011681 [Rousettus aegyptiacus]
MTAVHPSSYVSPHEATLLSIADRPLPSVPLPPPATPEPWPDTMPPILFKFNLIIEKPKEQGWSARNKDDRVRMIPVPFVRKLMRSPLQGKYLEKSKLEVKTGTRKSTNVSKTAEIYQEVTDKKESRRCLC